MKQLSIYIHIPFCVQKCRYCDFLSAPANRETIDKYLSALKREIKTESVGFREYEVATLFFGGGTPSILGSEDIRSILELVRSCFAVGSEPEITLEMNPGTASYEKLVGLRECGVNRLSIGLQSTWDDELKMLGRIHSYDQFLQTFNNARKAGFDNISVDLMSALPGQDSEKWRTTLERICELKPEHISAYSLIIEEGTYLYDNIDQFPALPSDEDDRNMYKDTKNILKYYGYARYEISNYAKPGYESRHNSVYWTRDSYVGFGLGASSMVENVRWKNTDTLVSYLNCGDIFPKEENEVLTKSDCMSEFMFLGLRMMKGVSKEKFFTGFGVRMDDVYGEILDKWIASGHLICEGDNVRLSDTGIDISNQIFMDFI